jgi:hypothetical protein
MYFVKGKNNQGLCIILKLSLQTIMIYISIKNVIFIIFKNECAKKNSLKQINL